MSAPLAILAKSRLTPGRDFVIAWVIDPDPGIPATASDVVTDLTGATVTASIVDTDPAATVIVATSAVSTSVSAADRVVIASIAAADTADLVPGIYRWSVVVTLSSGEKYAIPAGPAQVFAA